VARAQPLAQSAAGRIQGAPLRQAPQHRAQLFAGKRLDQIIAGPEAQRFHRQLDRRRRRHPHHGDIGTHLPQLVQQLESRAGGDGLIHQQDVDAFGQQQRAGATGKLGLVRHHAFVRRNFASMPRRIAASSSATSTCKGADSG